MRIAFLVLMVSTLIICPARAARKVERPSNEMPMYGGGHGQDLEQNKAYSASAAALGWKYFYSGDADTAIKRFNQAWMFDHESVSALWGFGVIMGQRAEKEDTDDNLRDSIKYLEMAKAKKPDDAGLMVDLALAHTMRGAFLQDEKKSPEQEFKIARELFEQAMNLAPAYPLLYTNWAILEFHEGNIPAAKELQAKAKQMGARPDPDSKKELEARK